MSAFVTNNTGNNEWYTPKYIIDSVKNVFDGQIDLDPASCEKANEIVDAKTYYSIDDDGLSKRWYGNIFLNPPYSRDLLSKFASKLVDSDYNQCIMLVNNCTETKWMSVLANVASAVCFHTGRIQFYKSDGRNGKPLQGQMILYFGDETDRFIDEFKQYGWCCKLVR